MVHQTWDVGKADSVEQSGPAIQDTRARRENSFSSSGIFLPRKDGFKARKSWQLSCSLVRCEIVIFSLSLCGGAERRPLRPGQGRLRRVARPGRGRTRSHVGALTGPSHPRRPPDTPQVPCLASPPPRLPEALAADSCPVLISPQRPRPTRQMSVVLAGLQGEDSKVRGEKPVG